MHLLMTRSIALSCLVSTFGACGQRSVPPPTADNPPLSDLPAAAPADTDTWVRNGASACEKYLTPEFVSAVLSEAHGQNQKTGPASCTFEAAHAPNQDFSTINIYLSRGGVAAFDADVLTQNGTPMQGVGDKAVQTHEDAVQAVKGDHICVIDVKPPYGNKLKGEAQAQKLGEVCNKLFALL